MTRDSTARCESDAVVPAPIMGVGWQRYVFPAIWLVYLGSTASAVQEVSSGASAVAGYALIGAFAIVYIVAGPSGWQHRFGQFWVLYGIGVALTAAEVVFAHQGAFVFLIYLAVLLMASEWRFRVPVIALFAVVATFVPPAVGWSGSPDWNDGFTVLLVAFAMFGFFHIIRANRELSAARAEVARLAAEGERSRIARDLHDLLGHSLTTITVKAGLARRLAERGDAGRALIEIREVETLSRRTLGDVRAAVAGHHEVTLAGELATSREVLRAAGVMAELPGSVDAVDPRLSEVFGWVLREGITNLVRHSHSGTCRVTLGSRWIEIADTGNGGAAGAGGSGLRGLRERVEALGGTLGTASTFAGFTLRAEVLDDAKLPTDAGSAGPPAGPAAVEIGQPEAATAGNGRSDGAVRA